MKTMKTWPVTAQELVGRLYGDIPHAKSRCAAAESGRQCRYKRGFGPSGLYCLKHSREAVKHLPEPIQTVVVAAT